MPLHSSIDPTSPDFARNAVLEQRYKGEPIKPGAQIQQGSSITLVLGNGIGGGQGFIVPDLFGLTYLQAKARLDSMGLSFGAVVPGKSLELRDLARSVSQEGVRDKIQIRVGPRDLSAVVYTCNAESAARCGAVNAERRQSSIGVPSEPAQ